MNGNDPFEEFRDALSALPGVPDGRTALEVSNTLKSRYAEVFEAIKKYEQIGKYRSSGFSLTCEDGPVDRESYSISTSVKIKSPRLWGGWSLSFGLNEFSCSDQYFKDASPAQRGSWYINEIPDFIDTLGKYLLTTFDKSTKPSSSGEETQQV